MRALKDGGILSVTLWNKEEPPKSVLKLYATMAAAAREVDDGDIADRFFVVASYLSTATVLYKRGGFRRRDIAKLREHTRAMSFDEIYYPGFDYDQSQTGKVLEDYERQIFFDAGAETDSQDELKDGPRTHRWRIGRPRKPRPASRRRHPKRRARRCRRRSWGQLAWHHLVHGGWDERCRPLRVRHPAAHQRAAVLRRLRQTRRPARVADRLELLQDEWGYLLLWATLVIACLARAVAGADPGRLRLAHHLQPQPRQVPHHRLFRLPGRRLHHGRSRPDFRFHAGARATPTVSASVLITGMLVFSGLGAFVSERYLDRARGLMPKIFIADRRAAGRLRPLPRPRARPDRHSCPTRCVCCSASRSIFPPAFLMGFPMPTAMTSLARLGKDHMFLWRGASTAASPSSARPAVPIIATSFGLNAVLIDRRRRLSAGDAGVLRRAAAAATVAPMPSPAPAATPA